MRNCGQESKWNVKIAKVKCKALEPGSQRIHNFCEIQLQLHGLSTLNLRIFILNVASDF